MPIKGLLISVLIMFASSAAHVFRLYSAACIESEVLLLLAIYVELLPKGTCGSAG